VAANVTASIPVFDVNQRGGVDWTALWANHGNRIEWMTRLAQQWTRSPYAIQGELGPAGCADKRSGPLWLAMVHRSRRPREIGSSLSIRPAQPSGRTGSQRLPRMAPPVLRFSPQYQHRSLILNARIPSRQGRTASVTITATVLDERTNGITVTFCTTVTRQPTIYLGPCRCPHGG